MISSLLKGFVTGAGLMYFYDPRSGRRRRARLRDQCKAALHQAQDFVETGVHDLENRLYGTRAELHSKLSRERPSDKQLEERVRARMGHYASSARDIDVGVQNGVVHLSGRVNVAEANGLLRAISHVRGVRGVVDHFSFEKNPESSLQQVPARSAGHHWTPAARLVGSAVGAGLMAQCALSRRPTSFLLGTLGFGLLLRSTVDPPSDSIGSSLNAGPRRAARAPATRSGG